MLQDRLVVERYFRVKARSEDFVIRTLVRNAAGDVVGRSSGNAKLDRYPGFNLGTDHCTADFSAFVDPTPVTDIGRSVIFANVPGVAVFVPGNHIAVNGFVSQPISASVALRGPASFHPTSTPTIRTIDNGPNDRSQWLDVDGSVSFQLLESFDLRVGSGAVEPPTWGGGSSTSEKTQTVTLTRQ